MTDPDCPGCRDRRRTARLLVLAGGRQALVDAADRLDEPATVPQLTALASLLDRLTVERVTSWLRRRADRYDDAALDLGGAAAPLAAAAAELAAQHAPRDPA